VVFLRTQKYEFVREYWSGGLRDLESLLIDLEISGSIDQNDLLARYSGGWSEDSDYHASCIHEILSFRHREDPTQVVQVIAVHDQIPPVCSVMWFHSSVSE
jgi:hypothetical protein